MFNNNVLRTIESLANAVEAIKDVEQFTKVIKQAKVENDRLTEAATKADSKIAEIKEREQAAEVKELEARNAVVYAEQKQALLEKDMLELKSELKTLHQVKEDLTAQRKVLHEENDAFNAEKREYKLLVENERKLLDDEKDRLAALRAELEDKLTALRQITE